MGKLLFFTGASMVFGAILLHPDAGGQVRPGLIDYRDAMATASSHTALLGLLLVGASRLRFIGSGPQLMLWMIGLIVCADRLSLAAIGLPATQYDPETHFTLRPEATHTLSWWVSGTSEDTTLLIVNEHGYRGDSFPIKAPAGEVRGFFIGDSVTMGAGVAGPEAFPALVGQLSGKGYQAINAGVAGYSTYQQRIAFERALPLGLHFIAIGFCLNDVTDLYNYDTQLGGAGWYNGMTQTANPILGYALNETGFGRAIQTLRTSALDARAQARRSAYNVRDMVIDNQGRYEEGWAAVLGELAQIYALAREDEVEPILLIFPYQFQLFYPHLQSPQERLSDHARAWGVRYINYTPLFEQHIRADAQRKLQGRDPGDDSLAVFDVLDDKYLLDQNHFSPAGHRIVAWYLTKELQRIGMADIEDIAAFDKVQFEAVARTSYHIKVPIQKERIETYLRGLALVDSSLYRAVRQRVWR